MGYELKMYVVNMMQWRSAGKITNIDNNVYSVYSEETNPKKMYYFLSDGNTKVSLPDDYKGTILSENICLTIGMIDLSCTDLVDTGICTFEKSDGAAMFNPCNGNEFIGIDPYGDYRSFVPIDTVIKELKEKTADKDYKYRRYTIALAMLKEVKKTFKGSKVGCLFVGH